MNDDYPTPRVPPKADSGGAPSGDQRRATYRACVVASGPREYTASISLVSDDPRMLGAGGLGSGIMELVEELVLELARKDEG